MCKNVFLVHIFLRFSENVSFWCTIIYNTNHLLLSYIHEWKYSYFRLSTCSYRTKGNLILTLCFAAISWPCSELTFLRWTKSTLFATSTIGKASLRGSHRQKKCWSGAVLNMDTQHLAWKHFYFCSTLKRSPTGRQQMQSQVITKQLRFLQQDHNLVLDDWKALRLQFHRFSPSFFFYSLRRNT